MTDKELRSILINPYLNGRMNHYVSDCPFCNKERHFYLNVHKAFKKTDGRYWGCWDCKSCGQKGNLHKLLSKLNKLFLLAGEIVDIGGKLDKKIVQEVVEKEFDLSLPDKELPIGFQRTYFNEYLKSRGFTKKEFEKYTVGTTNIIKKYSNFIIISLEENHKCKGFMGRNMIPKEDIDAINRRYKKMGVKKRFPRYRNSDNTEFSKILGGYDEILFTTNTAILVEGFFDKVRLDQIMELDNSDEVKCCYTNGKSVSKEQIMKLQRKGVLNVVLIQDEDAIKNTKQHAIDLKNEFDSVLVGSTGEKDLGDSSVKDVLKVFSTLKTPQEFFIGKVAKKKLIS